MRISFGGGPRRDGRNRFGLHFGFELGPIASSIVCLFIAIVGGFVTLLNLFFFNVIGLVLGAVFFLVGFFGFKSNISVLRSSRDDDDE